MKNKRYLVLGLGISGSSAALFLRRRGYHVIGVDGRIGVTPHVFEELKAAGVELISEKASPSFTGITDFIVSPGVAPENPWLQAAKNASITPYGEIELACRHMKQKAIAITGTNGKTTVTSLVAHVLNFHGQQALAAGNIGLPLTQSIDETPEETLLAVELSSWQLETLETAAFDLGLILNITPDHLDRHKTMHAYAAAKLRLAHCLKPNAPLFIHADVAQNYPDLLSDTHYKLLPPPTTDYALDNAAAASVCCQHFGVTTAQFAQALETFTKAPHRNEFICTKNGIHYYNDSKGTNLDAVVKAVESCPTSCLLIAGGMDKGSNFTSWLKPFAGKVRSICAIGETAEKIHKQLSHALPVTLCNNLEEAILQATATAETGDTVLLSPGCSSYDMFDNYAHRGDVFREFVLNLSD